MRQRSAGYQLIIFDNDGVLVDSETADYRVTAEVAARLGCILDRRAYAGQLMGRPFTATLDWIEARLGREVDRPAVTAYYTGRIAEDLGRVRPCPGAARVLRELHGRFCIATSRARPEAWSLLRTAGLARYVPADMLICGDDVRAAKPDGEIFLAAARRCGARPADCLVVEDSLSGVRAAQHARMQVVGVTGLLAASDFRSLGVPFIAHVGELLTGRPPPQKRKGSTDYE